MADGVAVFCLAVAHVEGPKLLRVVLEAVAGVRLELVGLFVLVEEAKSAPNHSLHGAVANDLAFATRKVGEGDAVERTLVL